MHNQQYGTWNTYVDGPCVLDASGHGGLAHIMRHPLAALWIGSRHSAPGMRTSNDVARDAPPVLLRGTSKHIVSSERVVRGLGDRLC